MSKCEGDWESDVFMTSTRQPVGNVEWADGYSYLKFRGEVQAGNRNLGAASISQILDSLIGKQQTTLATD